MKHIGGEFHHIVRKNLVLYRKKRGLTQEKLARKMNTNRTYISWLESGKANPTLTVLLQLAEHLEIEPSYLFVR
ncbi:MAG: helix-turn-helix transcriptional regulator [Lachnospiraceae bacterium]|nr:helix-turn-helix transcriptional regulator [Lachnospiraceae bacterium]